MLEQDYPNGEFVHVDWHISGSLQNGSGSARAAYYGGVTGTPSVYFDGVDNVTGAGDSVLTYNTYKPILDAHLTASTFSKAILSAQLDVNADSLSGTVLVDLEVAPGETIGNPQNCMVRAVLAENDITGTFFCCEPVTGRNDWDHISRALLFEVPLTATAAGDTQHVEQAFAIDPMWNPAKLECVAWIQRDTNFVILQAAKATAQYGITVVDLDPTVAKVSGPDTTYDVQVTYDGTTPDDVRISLDPSALPGGWSADLGWAGTTDPSRIVIPAMTTAQVETVTVAVHTAGAEGLGSVTVTTEPVSNASLAHVQDYHTFLNTPALLLVDDDNGASYETYFQDAIAASGHYAVTQQDGAAASFLAMFDAVIWTTGELATKTIGASAQAGLEQYLDGGGRLYLSSQGYLNQQGLTTFTTDYLGVDAFTADALADSATGVPGDPIGDGLSFALSPPFPDAADHLTPGLATTWLTTPLGQPIGVHLDAGSFRTVFQSASFEGITLADQATAMGRVVDWILMPLSATGAGAGAGAGPAIAGGPVLRVPAPSPFQASTTVRFSLPAAADVRLDVFDVTGRRVAQLLDGRATAGEHAVSWDGRDESGRRSAAGVYLVRLRAAGRTLTRDVVLLR